jgi:sec-independent protein translocase protein TatC
MSIMEHLEALRRMLIVCAAAWLLTTLIGLFFAGRAFNALVQRSGIPSGHVVYLDLTGGVILDIKVALYIGIIVAAPVIIQQLWWFISPGLHLHERRVAMPMVIATIIFFYLGTAFALYSLPLFVKVLTSLAPSDAQYLAGGSELLGFIMVMVLAFGIVFELPVVLYSLGRLGLISSKWLYKNRFYWVIGLGLLANVLTPGVDPVTPLILFVPLWVFWEGTALLLKLSGH